MKPPKPEPDNVPNGAPHDADEPTHANGPPGGDDRWLRWVVHNSSEVVTIVDLDGTLRYASPAFERVLGYDPEQAVGTMNVLDHVHLDDLPHVLEETEKAVSEGGIVTNKAEYRFRHRDGSWRWMESIGTYLLDDPEVEGVVVASRDVTERKEAEEALRRSEAEIFEVLESITDAFFALDREWRFTYVNSHAQVLFSRAREDLIGERIWEDPTFYPEYRKAVAEGITARFEAYYLPLGAWYSVRAYPSESGLSVYLQDVTERKRAEERIRFQSEVLEAVGQAVIATDWEGKVLYWNRAAEDLYGWSAEEVLGCSVGEFGVSEDLQGRLAEIREELRAGRSWSGEFTVLRKDGSTVPVLATDTPVYDERGNLSGIIGVSTDITKRKEAEEALRESEQRFKSTFEDAGIGMALSTPDGRYLRANRSFCELLGYSEEDLLGMTFRDVTYPDDLEVDIELGRRLLEGEDLTYSMEKRYVRKDGSQVWVDVTVSLLRGPSGEPLYSIAQVQDITERKSMEEQLQLQALHDTLTGLPNRKLFMDRLRHALERTRRTRGRKAAVLFMDLDGFKIINDSLGHEVGDVLLAVVAQRLGRCLRSEDTLARFGGDEFVVLLEDVEEPDEAVRVAGRVTDELRRPFVVEGRQVFVTASIGIAMGDARTKTPASLLRDADTAMYRAKDEHTDYKVFDLAMYERVLDRLELENDLRRAIERDEFVIHYEPIVDLKTGEARGMEALVRWEHPDRGLLNPSEFMPVVEENGLILTVGEGVLEKVCRQAQLWPQDRRTSPLVVSLSLSAVQLRRSDLARTVAQTLRKTGLDARFLSVGVTETAYIRVLERKTAALDRLKKLGVGISIDDFGVGYSSLSSLKRVPADVIKIDRSFVKGLGEDVEDTAIVRMIIDLAHTLGMKVVAEGVEGWAQAALLSEMGCDLGQGYHFARPLPPEEVPGFLAR